MKTSLVLFREKLSFVNRRSIPVPLNVVVCVKSTRHRIIRIIPIANISITFTNNCAIKYRECKNSPRKLRQNFSIVQYRLVSSCYLHLRRLNLDRDLLPRQTRVNQRGKSDGPSLSLSLTPEINRRLLHVTIDFYSRRLKSRSCPDIIPKIAWKQSDAP